MVALPFYACRKIVPKPPFVKYKELPQTLGDHIRKKRVKSEQFQKDLAKLLGVSEDTLTFWENNRYRPQVKHYPAIINYLGYYPFDHETETLAGKLRQIRYANGYCFERLAFEFKISVDAAKRWERGKPVMSARFRTLIESVWQRISSPYSKKTEQQHLSS